MLAVASVKNAGPAQRPLTGSRTTTTARPPEPPTIMLAFVISGAIITALARPRFCLSQVISGSLRKDASVTVAAVTSFR